jgi:hypothetical protein
VVVAVGELGCRLLMGFVGGPPLGPREDILLVEESRG